jgi:hypothetical protein
MNRLIRIAMILVAIGLFVQLVMQLSWSPMTFVLYAALGIPIMLLGIVLYGVGVIKVLRGKGAL